MSDGVEDGSTSPEREELSAFERAGRRVKLGEFVIESKIGAGGMGKVYKARQESLDRIVAVKLLPRSVADDPEAVQRLAREARSAAKLVHANVIQIYSFGQERGVPYIAMEYVEGDDLEHCLREGKVFSVIDSLCIASSVAMALSCGQEHNIVHRDIKPGNIMIDKHGVTKVMDFGLAKAVGSFDASITREGYVVGTPTYMAPEQVESEEPDIRSDIYSLGGVLHELLTGRPPFKASSASALIYKHMHEPPTPPSILNPNVTATVDAIVLRCLDKDPETRYQTPEVLLSDLLAARGELESHGETSAIAFDIATARRAASRVTTAASLRPESRRWSAGTAIGVAGTLALILLVVAGAFGIWTKLRPSPEKRVESRGGEAVVPEESSEPAVAGIEAPPLRAELSFDAVRELVPPSVAARLVGEEGLVDLPDGKRSMSGAESVVLKLERRNYVPREVAFKNEGGRVVPELSADVFRMELDEEAAKLLASARELVQTKQMKRALPVLNELNALALLPAETSVVQSLQRTAEAHIDAERERWNKVLAAAEEAAAERQWARTGELLKDFPIEHEKFSDAIELRSLSTTNITRTGALLAKAHESLSSGALDKTEDVLKQLAEIVNLDKEATLLREKAGKARALKHDAEEAEQVGDSARALKAYQEYLALCPSDEKAHEARDRVALAAAKSDKAGELIQKIGEALRNKTFDSAAVMLHELRKLSPDTPALPAFESRLAKGVCKKRIEDTLGLLDAFFSAANDTLPLAPALATRVRKEVAALHNAGASISGSKRKLVPGSFKLDGPVAVADVEWSWVIESTVFHARAEGVCRQTCKFVAEGSKRVVSEVSGTVLSAVGGGPTEKKEARIQGRVEAAEGDIVTLSVGLLDGVRTGMVFNVYRDVTALKLPLTDVTVFVEEKLVATVTVLEVRDRLSLGSAPEILVPGESVRKGDLVVYAPRTQAMSVSPGIVDALASPPEAPAGTPVRVKLDVSNPDGQPVHYEWEATGGLLEHKLTPGPEVIWWPPAVRTAEGAQTLKVTGAVVPASGARRERVVEVHALSARQSRELIPAGTVIPGGPAFVRLAHFTLDEKGNMYLMNVSGHLTILSTGLDTVSISGRCRERPTRAAVVGSKLYLLDSSGCRVLVYEVGEKMFEKGPAVSMGAPGNGNGKMQAPVDLAVTRNGEVAVLDAQSKCVQVFGADGEFVQSFGVGGEKPGRLTEPVAVCSGPSGELYVLDAGRKMVVVYAGGRFEREFTVGKAAKPLDMCYDASRNRLWTLADDGKIRQFALRGEPGTEVSLVQPGKAKALSVGPSGRLYVCSVQGTRIERYGGTGSFLGHIGLPRVDTPAFMAVLSDGSVVVGSSRTSEVLLVGRHGWILGTVAKSAGEGTVGKLSGLACDRNDILYLLDGSNAVVWKIGRKGETAEQIGRDEKTGKGMLRGPLDLAAGIDRLFVLVEGRTDFVRVFDLAGRNLASFPGKPVDKLSRPTRIAADASGRSHLGGSKQESMTFSPTGEPGPASGSRVAKLVDLVCGPLDVLYELDSSARVLKMFLVAEDRYVPGPSIELDASIRQPVCVATDKYGFCYVLDGGDGRIHRFSPKP